MTALDGRALPDWAPYGAFAGSAALAALLLLAAGSFSVALLLVVSALVACVLTYSWSRAVEGPRRAKDRLVTLVIVCAFALALIPLLSLIFEVAKRGIPGLSLEFITSDARGKIGGGGAAHALVGTLVITGVAALKAPPTLVLPAGWFKPKRVIEVYVEGHVKVRLTELLDRGSDYERVAYEMLT